MVKRGEDREGKTGSWVYKKVKSRRKVRQQRRRGKMKGETRLLHSYFV